MITRRGLFRSLLAAASFAVARHYAPDSLLDIKPVPEPITLVDMWRRIGGDANLERVADLLCARNPLLDDMWGK